MKIKNIELTNIKGIKKKTFVLDLLPNKPNLLVAPNGFGKSSISIGFNSLKRNKIELESKHYHQDSSVNRPKLTMVVEDSAGTRKIFANDCDNTLSKEFDIFVINSQLMAKAIKMKIGNNVIVKSSLEIAPTILVPTIPFKILFNYNSANEKKKFGFNGKILPNISNILNCAPLLFRIINEIEFFEI